VNDKDFDYAFHLAAMVGGRLMIENNPLAVADDLSIDSEYWQWAQKAHPKKTICFSSSAAYPVKHQRVKGYVLLKEDMIQFDEDIGMPDMSYGWAKLTCEYLAKLAYDRHGLKSVAYRPFSGYGEDQDLTYPFPSICKRTMESKGKETLTVWGSGDQMRDFIHISDCVEGVLTTMDKIDNGDALNLSTGIFTSFKQFAAMAADLCGYKPEVKGTSDKPEGVFARGGDTTKQKKFGFEYSISFKDGIKRALDFISTNKN
jgi:GDP-L-fucose synthase